MGVDLLDGDDAHLLYWKPGLVEFSEHLDDILGDCGIDDHLAGVKSAVEAVVAHGEIDQIVESYRTFGYPTGSGQDVGWDGFTCRLEFIAGWRWEEVECLELSIFKLRWGWLDLAKLVGSEWEQPGAQPIRPRKGADGRGCGWDCGRCRNGGTDRGNYLSRRGYGW